MSIRSPGITMVIGGWNLASLVLFFILFAIYTAIFSLIDRFVLPLGFGIIILAIIFAIITEYPIEKRLGWLEEQPFREPKKDHANLNEIVDKTRCMSCMAELLSDNSKCPNCGYDYAKLIDKNN